MTGDPPIPSTISTRDPAHPSNPNQDHTTKDGEKPKDIFTAITDPEFIPTLEHAPKLQQLKSYIVLLSLIAGGVVGAWLMGFELFQFTSASNPDIQIPFQPGEGIQAKSFTDLALPLGLVILVLWALISFTGALWIDWWELVLGYWWLSMPAGAAAVLFLILSQESSKRVTEVD